MLRVLHVVPNIDPKQGGPARSVVTLVQALRQMPGLEIRLAAAGDPEKVDLPLRIRTRFSLLSGASRRALREEIAQADMVELNSLWNGVISYAAKTCRRLRRPYVFTPRGMLDPYCLKTRGWLKRLSAWMGEEKNIAGAAGFHLLSQEEEQGMLAARPYLQTRQRVVSPNGLGPLPEAIDSGILVKRFPETTGRQTVLFLGRLDAIKGLDLALEALALIPAARRPIFLFVGPDFGALPALRRQAADLGVAPWALFVGPVYGEDRFGLLAGADVVGLTSVYECNSVTATEAFAVGGVVAGTEGNGLRQAAQAGAAVLVSRTPQDFARLLQELLGDKQRREHLRMSARLYAHRQLDWAKLIEPLTQMYRRIVQSAASPS